MLRKVRIVLAAVFFVGITLLFLDFTGAAHKWLGWMADIQFLPAVLAANAITVASLLLVTVLFGRIYCSVICPLGIMQDIISWFRGKLKKKDRFRFSYSPARKVLRYGFLAIFIVALAAGVHSLAILIAPYSAYGRIAANLLAPIYQWGNNLLAWIAERADSYAFYSTDVWIRSIPTFVVAVVTFIVIFFLAFRSGRTWCNTVCPVGTLLGFFSKRSIFAPVIDTEKCRNCGLCEKQCKASCISMKEHEVDYSRCVACMDCIDTCKDGAISYTWRWSKKTAACSNEQTRSESSKDGQAADDPGRRAFMTSALLVAGTAALKAQEMKVDGGLTPVSYAKEPDRKTPLVPAGSLSLKNFQNHCTGCQLCVSACPNHVLTPSASLMNLMQPQMSFTRGFCRPECTACSDACPSGAIRPVSIEEKSSIQIGHAVIEYEDCVINKDKVNCGNCSRHCPTGAIRMVSRPDKDSQERMFPVVNEEKCIGCGACENVCPARPYTAIRVTGHQVHKTI